VRLAKQYQGMFEQLEKDPSNIAQILNSKINLEGETK
jgi:hypothetical protein